LARVFLVVSAVLLPVGVIAGWASATLYDSGTFSRRAGNLLRSQAIRHKVSVELTDQLAAHGNEQAVDFRPAMELAVEGAIDTEAFQSIFRTAVATTHHDLLAGGEKGIDLSQALPVIATNLQLPNNARPGQNDASSMGNAFTQVTQRLHDFHVWQIEGWAHSLWLLGVFGGRAAGAAAIALAGDRRRMVTHLGWVLVADGAVIAGAVVAIQWYVGRPIADAELAAAVHAGVGRWTGDLRNIGLWVAGYGVVLAGAAASAGGRTYTPARVAAVVGGWVDRRRASTGGTVGVGAVGVLVGLVLIRYHTFWSQAAVLLLGLWLAYLGAAELMSLLRRVVPAVTDVGGTRHRGRRVGILAGVAVVVLALVTASLVVTTAGANKRAEAGQTENCNGSPALCDLPLNKVMMAGTHNSMSSERYTGWMFAEHIRTIREQLDAGVRALLIDTHYGIPSTARMLGSNNQLIVTDREHELVVPNGEPIDTDPSITAKARALSAQVPPAAAARRGIYLCHNWCEMGAIRFSDGLAEVKGFIDTHPDEVVMLDIEDHTAPAETAAVIEKSGLADRAITLDPKAPMPTLGHMLAARKNVVIVAEGDGPGAPPWYQFAYKGLIQETEYAWKTRDEMDCRPKRGSAESPLFLVNHWVGHEPPSPKVAGSANTQAFLEARLRQCLAQRGRIPNIVAVDFSGEGDLVKTVRALNAAFVNQLATARRHPGPSPPPVNPDSGKAEPPVAPLVPLPLPASAEVTTFTGGDPTAFCDGWTRAVEVVGASAEAHLLASTSDEGLADLAYGPATARALDAVADSAPTEIGPLLVPTRDRAHAAVDVLRNLGLDDDMLDGQARVVIDASAGGTEAQGDTPSTVALARTQFLHATYGADRVDAAADAFARAHPPQPGLFDLGRFSPQTASAAGYDCLVPTAP